MSNDLDLIRAFINGAITACVVGCAAFLYQGQLAETAHSEDIRAYDGGMEFIKNRPMTGDPEQDLTGLNVVEFPSGQDQCLVSFPKKPTGHETLNLFVTCRSPRGPK